MKPHKLTQHEAWKLAAKLWAEAAREGLDYVNCCEGLISYGICFTLSRFYGDGLITKSTLQSMNRLMKNRRPEDAGDGYWWIRTPACAKVRAEFCRKMARLTKPKVAA